VSIVNLGNVSLRLRGTYALGLYDTGGIEAATFQAFVGSDREKKRAADALVEALARGHGGLAMITVAKADELAVGGLNAYGLTIKLPDALEPGRSYFGSISFAQDARLPVGLDVPAVALREATAVG
jgi:hypothetical protein